MEYKRNKKNRKGKQEEEQKQKNKANGPSPYSPAACAARNGPTPARPAFPLLSPTDQRAPLVSFFLLQLPTTPTTRARPRPTPHAPGLPRLTRDSLLIVHHTLPFSPLRHPRTVPPGQRNSSSESTPPPPRVPLFRQGWYSPETETPTTSPLRRTASS